MAGLDEAKSDGSNGIVNKQTSSSGGGANNGQTLGTGASSSEVKLEPLPDKGKPDDYLELSQQDPKPTEPRSHPLDEKGVAFNPFNRLFFHFLTRIFDVGNKRILQREDLFLLPSNQKPQMLTERFETALRQQSDDPKKRDWLRAAISVSWVWWFVAPAFYLFVYVVAFGFQPLLLQGILESMEGITSGPLGYLPGWAIACLMALDTLVNAVFMQMGWGELCRAATVHRTLVMQWVMEKALRLTAGSRQFCTTGQIVTLMAVDADRIAVGIIFSHWIWICVVQLIIVIVYMVQEIGGFATGCAMIVVVLLIIFQWGTAKTLRTARAKTTKMTDVRVRLINEIIQGVRVIKAYAWESAAIQQVEETRSTELKNLRTLLVLMGVNYAVMFIAPVFVGLVAFLCYEALGGVVTVSGVFTTFAAINLLRLPVKIIPMVLRALIEASISFRRLQRLMQLPEIQDLRTLNGVPVNELPDGNCDERLLANRAEADTALVIRNCRFAWIMPGDEERANGLDPASTTRHSAMDSPLKSAGSTTRRVEDSEDTKRSDSTTNLSNPKNLPNGDSHLISSSNFAGFSLEINELSIAQGELICVIGVVGSGKSSLLNAMLGELVLTERSDTTTFDVCGPRSYVSQTAWIQNLAMRDVIAFGSAFNADIYERVIECCQLKPDIAILPNGDQTEIGERGINLSGGQKQRVAVARAAYHKCVAASQQTRQGEVGNGNAATASSQAAMDDSANCIFLLDDPLSAVDLHVASALFEQVILNPHMMGDRTRVLVLNSHYHLMRRADRIVIMDNGRIHAVGTFDALLESNALFASMVDQDDHDAEESESGGQTHKNDDEDDAVDAVGERSKRESEVFAEAATNSKSAESEIKTSIPTESVAGAQEAIPGTREQTSGPVCPDDKKSVDDMDPSAAVDNSTATGQLIEAEEQSEGAVTIRTYVAYFQAATSHLGLCVFVTIVVSFAIAQSARTVDDWFLAEWATTNGTDQQLEILYASFAGLTFVMYIVSSVSFMVVAVAASKNFHNKVFAAVLAAPVNLFFDVTPVGRILNRFGKDIDQIDILVPDYLIQFLQNGCFFVSAIIMCIIATPWFGLGMIPLVVVFFLLGAYFRRSIREMKRIEAVSRSPVYSSFTEALNGVNTIRAFKKSRSFINAHAKMVDFSNGVWMTNWMAGCWFGQRVDTIGSGIVLGVGLAATLINDPNAVALVGLALTFTLQFMSLLQWTVRVFIETETNMIAVERLNHYVLNVPAEQSTTLNLVADGSSESKLRLEEWPSHGAIEFRSFVMSYRPGLPTVLKGVDLSIRAQEKVGVCGRTGAGKSSLIVALLRICEGSSGSIHIDGLDIRGIPLKLLRTHVSLIPQEPFLFSTTVRQNLDPFEEHSDMEVWNVLEAIALAGQVRAFDEQLQHRLTDNGGNLSQGTRQLICMGRALLRRSKVIVMDEATASVDTSTDNAIQRMIATNFAYATVVTIAHRINTIMNSDRVAVMDAGVVVEYDSPQNLLENPNGHFFSLVGQMHAEDDASTRADVM